MAPIPPGTTTTPTTLSMSAPDRFQTAARVAKQNNDTNSVLTTSMPTIKGMVSMVARARFILTNWKDQHRTDMMPRAIPSGSPSGPVDPPRTTNPDPRIATSVQRRKRSPGRSPNIGIAHNAIRTGLSIVSNEMSTTEVNLTEVMNMTIETALKKPAQTGSLHSRPRGKAMRMRPDSATAAKIATIPIQDRQNANTGPLVDEAWMKTGAVLKATAEMLIRSKGRRDPTSRSCPMAAEGLNACQAYEPALLPIAVPWGQEDIAPNPGYRGTRLGTARSWHGARLFRGVDDLQVIGKEDTVGSYQSEGLELCLGNQHPVEWVTVRQEGGCLLGMPC